MKRLLISLAILFFFSLSAAFAQFGVGVSYEYKPADGNLNNVPQSGFGVRLENSIGPKFPGFKLGYRLHASFFRDEQNLNQSINDIQAGTYNSDVYDFGAAFLGEVKIPFLANPYAGLGIGYELQDIASVENVEDVSGIRARLEQFEESSLFYNAFIGVKFSPIPVIRPFVEYRFSGFSALNNITDSPRRFHFGILLEF